jgi:hypothetical protein
MCNPCSLHTLLHLLRYLPIQPSSVNSNVHSSGKPSPKPSLSYIHADIKMCSFPSWEVSQLITIHLFVWLSDCLTSPRDCKNCESQDSDSAYWHEHVEQSFVHRKYSVKSVTNDQWKDFPSLSEMPLLIPVNFTSKTIILLNAKTVPNLAVSM